MQNLRYQVNHYDEILATHLSSIGLQGLPLNLHSMSFRPFCKKLSFGNCTQCQLFTVGLMHIGLHACLQLLHYTELTHIDRFIKLGNKLISHHIVLSSNEYHVKHGLDFVHHIVLSSNQYHVKHGLDFAHGVGEKMRHLNFLYFQYLT